MLLGTHVLLVFGVLVVELYCLVRGFTQSCVYCTEQYGLHSITLQLNYNGVLKCGFYLNCIKCLYILRVLCGFDRASSIICGNKMPTR
jgi:hypothetical protein